MPQAIERSVATPTISARLPERMPTPVRSSAARFDEGDQHLTGVQMVSTGPQIVPSQQVADRDLQQPGDPVERIAAAHDITHAAACGARRGGPAAAVSAV